MKKLITVVPLLIAIGFSACSVFQTKKEKDPYADVEKPSEEMAKRAGVSKRYTRLGDLAFT
ncbi:MAG: hypothetical protein HC767_01895 [Akkermansiaceae bacterium]|nr:hypothetical protein [Akkermansiaceae bacterium]